MPFERHASLVTAVLLLAHGPLQAEPAHELVKLVNGFRAAPAECDGHALPRVPALAHETALSRVTMGTGTILVAALDQSGYEAEQADAIKVSGPPDAAAAFAAMREPYCRTLRERSYAAVGASRVGNAWTVVLARPMPDLKRLLPDWQEAGRAVLAATNLARSQPRKCGNRPYAAAPPLSWNEALASAALAHSTDMGTHRFFSHTGHDGRTVDQRANNAGYTWARIGENIAAGQRSVAEAVAGWLESPRHCANLMNPAFKEMGAAYALRGAPRPMAYWTQVFGTRP